MGYRHYLIKIEKSKIEELENLTERKLQTMWYNLPKMLEEEKNKWSRYGRYDTLGISNRKLDSGKRYFSDFEDFAYAYMDTFNKGQLIHELGKLRWGNTEERLVSKGREPNYKDNKIKERITTDHCFSIGGKEMIEEYMKVCKENYIQYLNSLSIPEDENKLENLTSWINTLETTLEKHSKSTEKKVETSLFNTKKDSIWSKKQINRKKVIRELKRRLIKAKLKKEKYLKFCEKNKDKLIYDKLKEHLYMSKSRAEWLGNDWEYRTAYTRLLTLLNYDLIDFDKYYILLYAW